MNLKRIKRLFTLLLLAHTLIFTSCGVLFAIWLLSEAHTPSDESISYESASYEEFVKNFENWTEPENYTFTYTRYIENNQKSFTVKVTNRKSGISYKGIDNKGNFKPLSESQFAERFDSRELFSSLSDIYKFFIENYKKIRENDREYNFSQDWGKDEEETIYCSFDSCIISNAEYNYFYSAYMKSVDAKTYLNDDYFGDKFDSGYCIDITEFEVLN